MHVGTQDLYTSIPRRMAKGVPALCVTERIKRVERERGRWIAERGWTTLRHITGPCLRHDGTNRIQVLVKGRDEERGSTEELCVRARMCIRRVEDGEYFIFPPVFSLGFYFRFSRRTHISWPR